MGRGPIPTRRDEYGNELTPRGEENTCPFMTFFCTFMYRIGLFSAQGAIFHIMPRLSTVRRLRCVSRLQ